MKNLISTTLFLIFIISTSIAQSNNSSIVGRIIDQQNLPVSYATVSIKDMEENLILGGITEDNGKFELDKVAMGEYLLEVSFLGYESYTTKIQLNSKKLKLDDIVLSTNENMLNEVNIRAEKSQYNIRMDKKIFNVGKDVIAQGGTALDVLDQVPQVSVQPSGAVELRGSSAVQILINGRRSGLTMNNAIEQIATENIDRIEVITNPSARYDASGSAGIINIILKKDKGEGLKGEIRTTVGTPANYILMPSLSYKTSKLNLFGNIRWRYSDYNGIYTVNQTNTGIDAFTLNSKEIEDRHDDGLTFYLGGDYIISENTNATLAYFRANTKDTDHTELDYELSRDEVNEDILRTGNSLERRDYNQLEANIDHKFATEGSKLTFNLQYDFWNSKKDWDLTTTADELPDNIEANLRTENKAGSKDLVISADLDWPLWGGKFAAGLKSENRKVDNTYLAETLKSEAWETYSEIDNDVDYREMISAGYVDYSHALNKLQVKFGLRAEQSNIKVDDAESIYIEDKNYFNLFPSAFASYPISEAIEIQAGYSRRINRPSLWDIYPFSELTNINVVATGNPDLDPSYTNGYEISGSIRSEKLSFNPGLYYRKTSDAMDTYVAQDEEDFFTTTPVNIEEFNVYGMEFTTRYRPMDLLSFNLDFNYFLFDQSGNYEGTDMGAEGSTWRTRLNTNIRLKDNTRFMISYQYRGPQKNAQVDYLSSSDLSLSASRSFFNDQFEVSARAHNILDTRRSRSITQGTDYTIARDSRRTGARFSLNLAYKFNYSQRDRMRRENRGNR